MKPKTKAIIREYVESILIAFVLAMLIRTFVVQPFKIPTGSMRPTLIEGDRILVNKFIYRFQEPQRGDIVVFRFPSNPRKDFIKRLVAKEAETVEIRQGRIVIDNQLVDEPRLLGHIYYNRGDYGQKNQAIEVPRHHFYVLGDNSASSRDSRFWGFVPRRNLIGRAFLIYWPPSRIRPIK